MSKEAELVRATLAAAIVTARGAKSIEEIAKAWLDAKYIVTPRPADVGYKAWQIENGMQPTTEAEDAARHEASIQKSREVAKRLVGLS